MGLTFLLRHRILFVLVLAVELIAAPTLAAAVFTLQGRLTDSAGVPFESNPMQFKVQLVSPTDECILYEEDYSIDMTGSDGLFSLSLNNGSGTRVDTNTWNLADSFSNKKSFSVDFSHCSTGSGTVVYSPSAYDERKMKVFFKNTSMGTWDSIPTTAVSHSAYAFESEKVGGFGPSALCRVENSGVPQTVSALTSAQFTELLALVNGTSTQYATVGAAGFTANVDFNSHRLTEVAAPTASTDAVNKDYADKQIGGMTADSTVLTALAAGDAGKTLSWDGTKWTAATASATDITKLPLAGGTMTGAIDMGGYNITNTGNVELKTQVTLLLGRYTSAQETTLVAGLAAADKGRIWFNTTTGTQRIWTGTTAVDVGSGTVTSVTGTAPIAVATGTSTPVISITDATTSAKGAMQVGSGLAVSSGVVSADIGTSAGKVMGADAVPNCTSSQKLQMAAGPTYAWSCVTDQGLTTVSNSASLADTKVWVGDGSGKAQERSLSGDVTISNTGVVTIGTDAVTTAKITDANVTYAKIQNVTTSRLLGRSTAGAGVVEELSIGGGLVLSSGTLNANVGTTAGTVMGASAVPNCLSSEKLQMSAGPTYSWSCVTDLSGGSGDFKADGTVALTGNVQLNGHWLSGDGGAEGVYVTSAGNVGIGTTAPGAMLEVNGSMKVGGAPILATQSIASGGSTPYDGSTAAKAFDTSKPFVFLTGNTATTISCMTAGVTGQVFRMVGTGGIGTGLTFGNNASCTNGAPTLTQAAAGAGTLGAGTNFYTEFVFDGTKWMQTVFNQ